MQSTRTLAVLLAAASTVAAQGLIQSSGQFEVIIKSGDVVAGTGGATISPTTSYVGESLDLDGYVSWVSQLTGTGVVQGMSVAPYATDNTRVLMYARSAAEKAVVLRGDDPVPGMPGFRIGAMSTGSSPTAPYAFNGLPSYTFAGKGNLIGVGVDIYDSTWSGGATYNVDDDVFLFGTPTTLAPLIRQGDPIAPGSTTYVKEALGNLTSQYVTILGPNKVLMRLELEDSVTTLGNGEDQGWFIVSPGWTGLMSGKIIMEGETIPDGTNAVIGTLGTQCQASIDGFLLHDQFLLTGSGTPAVTATDNQAYLVWDPNTNTNSMLSREGWPIALAPTTTPVPPATVVKLGQSTLGVRALSNNKHVAFVSNLQDTPNGFDDDQALVVGDLSVGSSSLKVVLREGDPIPGHPGGFLGNIFGYSIVAYDNGDVTFGGSMYDAASSPRSPWPGANQRDKTYFRYEAATGNWGPIIMFGDPAPGMSGWTVGSSSGFHITAFSGYLIGNDHDGFIFETTVNDGTATAANDRSVHFWRNPFDGSIQPLAIENTTTGDDLGFGPCKSFLGSNIRSNEGSSNGCNANGDCIFRGYASPDTGLLRFRIGSLTTDTASIQASTGGTQMLKLDLGPTGASQICFTLGCLGSTRPGFSLPYGGVLHHIPLSPDFWFNAVPGAWGGPMYPAGINVTDANGKATSPFNFPPAGYMAGAMFNHCLVTLTPGVLQHISSPASCHLY